MSHVKIRTSFKYESENLFSSGICATVLLQEHFKNYQKRTDIQSHFQQLNHGTLAPLTKELETRTNHLINKHITQFTFGIRIAPVMARYSSLPNFKN